VSASSSYPLRRERNLILGLLVALALAAWLILIRQSATLDQEMMGPTMGLGPPIFLAIWVLMMVAMMFPTAAPMILLFARVHAGKRQRGQSFVPTWVFVGGYLLVWTAFGALAYGLALAAEALVEGDMWLMNNGARLGGAALVLAGLYQLSPLKRSCLAKCRSPLDFIMTSWRDGYPGSFRMGLEHGMYCLGCCWLLFVILFPLGMMNVAAMALITLLIFAEKSLAVGPRISQIAALALIAYGGLVVFVPAALPTMPSSGGMTGH
jgi:predicted metal-binding membrane protein